MAADARTDILNRIQQGLARAYLPSLTETTPPPPAPPPFAEPLVDVFTRAAAAVYTQVHQVRNDTGARDMLIAQLKARECRQVLAWTPAKLHLAGLSEALRQAGIELVDSRLPGPRRLADLERLEPIAVGLTAAAAGLARTGSVAIFADRDQGRLASLLPLVHYVLLRAEQIYPDIAAWLAADGVGGRIGASSNTIIITGPSRTADIAQTLTLGAHGPREVHVVLVTG